MRRRVLVIEDNPDMADLLALHLKDLSYDIEIALEGRTGLKMALENTFDLIILDLMLPGIDGLEICKRIRSTSHYIPILMLTAKSTELDRVLGLEIGADDYLTKPFSIQELLARVKAIFRRVEALATPSSSVTSDVLHIDTLDIDTEKRTVRLSNHHVDLTAREFDLLTHFARHPGRVYTRAQLLDEVWGYGHDGYEHTVNSHINRLRSKIERNPAQPKYILTVWGIGYKFYEPE